MSLAHNHLSVAVCAICERKSTLVACAKQCGYFQHIRDICDRHGVLLILDEVMCGMGRTGHLFACEAENIVPDIVTIAKGLGAGYQPIGVMLCQDFIFDAIGAGSGSFQHGHTYLGHPMACAAAGAVLTRLVDDGLVAGVTAKGARLREQLEAVFGHHPHVGDIRGRGCFSGWNLLQTVAPKRPLTQALHCQPA